MPLVILAGKEYGSGSSRDWAAKGTSLLGVRAVIAESFERIHRSNLVGMGVLPLQFLPGESVAALGLTGRESFRSTGSKADRRDAAASRSRRSTPTGPSDPSRCCAAWTVRSRSTTTARAASSRRCCGASPRSDSRRRDPPRLHSRALTGSEYNAPGVPGASTWRRFGELAGPPLDVRRESLPTRDARRAGFRDPQPTVGGLAVRRPGSAAGTGSSAVPEPAGALKPRIPRRFAQARAEAPADDDGI